MPIKDATAIDKNFIVSTSIDKEDLSYYDAKNFDVYGVTYVDGVYRRMPYDIANNISKQVGLISLECAGGRIRFCTDSPYIAIFVKYRAVAKVPNYSFSATMGFDLYSGQRYVGCFVPAIDTIDTFESILDFKKSDGLQEYTLNFPVCQL